MAGAVAMIPITVMERALGYFSDGMQGWMQALEFLFGGMALALVVGFAASWVVHGFVVRSKESEESEERRPAAGGDLKGVAQRAAPPAGRAPTPPPHR